MRAASTSWRLTVRSNLSGKEEYGSVSTGGVVDGLREDISYRIAIEGPGPCRLFIDDVELQQTSDGSFAWSCGFFAGRVAAIVVEPAGRQHIFYLDVSPVTDKLGVDQFDAMVSEVREFDARSLLGDSPAAIGFGRQGHCGRFDMQVRWARLVQYGPAFLSVLHEIARRPHRSLQSVEQTLTLNRLRRLPPSSLRDRRIASLATGVPIDDDSLDSLRLEVHAPAYSTDTPANRALAALLSRFRQTIHALTAWAQSSDGEHGSDGAARCTRRLAILGEMRDAVERLLRGLPFNEVSRADTTAAGLMQVAAHPLYGRAYRKGVEALRGGISGEISKDLVHVSPSWGVYETWCFVRLHALVQQVLDTPLEPCRASAASSDLAMEGTLPDGRRLELLFQAVFPSERPFQNRRAWSVSAERRPDIVLMLTEGPTRRFIVFDAKYRSGRTNTLDAMSSAHIYHDALRLDGQRPDLCLLLLPGDAAVNAMEAPSFWNEHGVGTLSEFAITRAGVDRCAELLGRWVSGT